MPQTALSRPQLITRRNFVLALAMFTLLTGLYLLTYSGVYISNDETGLFDATESFARRGNTRVTYMLNVRLIREYKIREQPDTPLVDAEPMQIVLAAILFRVAEMLPGIGLVHAVWLLNVLICAATASVVFLYARLLHYSERVSIGAALLFGVGAIAWPYSKVFFREPLAMFLIFSAAFCLHAWRLHGQGRGRWGWFAGFLLLFFMALLTKEAAILSTPIMVAIALPRLSLRDGWWRLPAVLLLVGSAGLLLALAINGVLQIVEVPRNYDVFERARAVIGQQEFILYALVSYLFSPGRGLFTFSPVLVLAVPGFVLLRREQRRRQLIVVLVALAAFVGGYAVFRHVHWYGGLAWGPRYLVPATPFVMLGTLPVLERFFQRAVRRWQFYAVLAVLIASVWVQLNGVLISQTAYYRRLETFSVAAWQEGTWQWPFTPLAIIPGLLLSSPLDFAWLRVWPDGAGLLAGALVLIGVGSAAIIVGLRREPGRRYWWLVGLLPILIVGVLYGGLRSIYRDPVYMGDFEPLQALLVQIEQEVQPPDILVLTNPEYQNFMMNHYRGRALVYTLPTAPGERPSPEQPPVITSLNPDKLLEPRYMIFLDSLPEYTGRVWLLNDSGPFTGFTVRPVEWYMARHYFPLETIQTGDTTRLIAFDVTANAPPPQAMRWPDTLTDAVFGGQVSLVGFDIPAPRQRVGPYTGPDPNRTTYRPGETVPLSLLWHALEQPALDYNIGVFVVGPAGTVVEQHTAPQWAFRPMDQWQASDYVRDNHGLQLPPGLPAGDYSLWVKVYAWQTGEPLQVTGAQSTADGTAAHLTTIRVEP
ncbi:MAG: hypothetical protein Kow0077_09860 [Anaerolineae bacterium]